MGALVRVGLLSGWLAGGSIGTPCAAGREADNFIARSLTTERGLPQNTARALSQTRDGYMWIGTADGLARFDGLRFTVYRSEIKVKSTGAARVEQLVEDEAGRLWIRTSDALIAYFRGEFRLHLTTESAGITCIGPDRVDGLWVGTRMGLRRFVGGVIQEARPGAGRLPGGEVTAIRTDYEGRLWAAFVRPLGQGPDWWRWDPRSGEALSIEALTGFEDARDVRPNPGGGLLIVDGDGWWRWSEAGRTRLPSVPGIEGGFGAFTEGEAGEVWVAPPYADSIFHLSGGGVSRFPWKAEFQERDLRALLLDREGNIWVGTGGSGVTLLQPRRLRTLYGVTSAGERQEVFSVNAGGGGRIWLGSSSGLIRVEGGESTLFTNDFACPPGSPGQGIKAVVEDRAGQVWMALDQCGPCSLREGRMVREPWVDPEPGRPAAVQSLVVDSGNRLWVGTSHGLYRRSGDTITRFTRADGMGDEGILSVLEGREGTIWIGTRNGGVHALRDGRFRIFSLSDGLPAQGGSPLLVEADGTVWVGTELGLSRLRGNEIRTVTCDHGLPDDLAYELIEDDRGSIWSHGNRGVWSVRREDLHAVADGRQARLHCTTYGEADGMLCTEGNGERQPAGVRGPDGRLWFPTIRGVVVVDPGQMHDKEAVPPVVIEHVRAGGRAIFADGRVVGPERAAAALLRPGEVRAVEIEYTANSFVASEKVRFQHRLEGHDSVWQDAGTRRIAFYTNLRPGSYRFRVNACNSHGRWSEEPAAFAFVVEPYFHETGPFYVLCGLGLVGIAIGLQAYRLRVQRQLHRLEQQAVVARERSRIAQDMHDDLGSDVTKIAILSEVARRDASNQLRVTGHLSAISELARGVVGGITDLVWSVNPTHDALASLVAHLREHAARAFEGSEIRCDLHFPEALPPLALPAEFRRNILLLFKEAIHNVLKHAGATQVRVSVEWLPLPTVRSRAEGAGSDELEIVVCDDGRGFQPEAATSGNGLANIRSRAGALRGVVTIDSRVGSGTTVRVRVPVPGPVR